MRCGGESQGVVSSVSLLQLAVYTVATTTATGQTPASTTPTLPSYAQLSRARRSSRPEVHLHTSDLLSLQLPRPTSRREALCRHPCMPK